MKQPGEASVAGANSRAEALVWVEKAAQAHENFCRLALRIEALETQIKNASEALPKDASVELRTPLWTLEQDLLEAKDAAVERDAERRRHLRQALILYPNLLEALEALSEDCIERHRGALLERQSGLARSIQAEALEYLDRLEPDNEVRKQGLAYFRGDRRIQLSLPGPMSVEVEQFKTQMKRLVPEHVGQHAGEHLNLALPVGSYLLTLESPDYETTRYPVYLEHGRDWDTKGPGGSVTTLPIPRKGELGAEDRYVPEGWFYAGGDPDAPNGKAQVRVWLDGFVIRETPVTHLQYLAFINDLLNEHGLDEANLWLPREQSTSDSELGKPIYVQNGETFVHSLGPAMNHHPVVHVTWYQAVAFTQWLAQQTKQPWRLPLELEWEKAARGVDRRCFPWGSQFDPMFCVMMDSHVGKPEIRSLDEILLDVSLYGVRSMAGNTREWCLDLFRADHYPVLNERALLPSDSDLMSEEFRSCRGGSYGNAATRTRSGDRDWWFPGLSYVGRGFRIARPWPLTDGSAGLQSRIERAYAEFHAAARARHAVAADHLKKKIEHATSELREQADQLKEIDRQKTTFFQNMSHELRTPLTLILNPLEEEALQQSDNQNLQVAAKNARRLLRLVNQLLDFQKLEAGKKELKLAPVDINRFTHVCGDYFHSACSTKRVDFSVHREGEPLTKDGRPIWMMGEVDALEKVTFNYLSNALKFTPEEGHIELGLVETLDKIRLFIKDSGPGISSEGQAKLFQVFSQVDEATTRSYEGTGLGLALVKSLVEEMGGEVGVQSETGQGSTFWAEFPLCDEPEETEVLDFEVKSWLLEQGEGETGTGNTGMFPALNEMGGEYSALVLVVDDLADMRALIASSLKKRNYRVATAPNGKRGVEIAKEIRPDLIISDWMMPQMSGPELIESLKRDDELNSVPIILLTAKSDEESKLIGTEMGADAFLGKPFNDQELGSIVKNLLSLKSREREVEELNHMLTETVLKRYISPVLVDKIIAGEISMDKPAEMRTITVLFSDLSGFTKASAKLGPKALSSFLNEYLTKMSDVIFEHGGTIDKFIGDAIMVIFGAPQDMSKEEQAKRATDCAVAMQGAMETIVSDWRRDGAGHLQMRIGLHQGEAIVGNFGSDRRSDYTCIGPTVNLAARIESAGEAGHVYLSRELKSLLPKESTVEAGSFELKGIEGKTTLYKLR